MNSTAIRNGLAEIFGPAIGVGLTNPGAKTGSLWFAEEAAIARAVPKRVLEFTAGRTAARQAMKALNLPEAAIPMAQDRAPVWPAGLAGSISHCDDLCVAVVTQMHPWRAIGIDIEDDTPLHKETWPILLTRKELSELNASASWKRGRLIKALFSIKEAVYKAQYPVTGELFDFQALNVTLDGNRFTAELTRDVAQYQKGLCFTGGYFYSGKYLISGCAILRR